MENILSYYPDIEIFWKDLSESGQDKIIAKQVPSEEIIKNQIPLLNTSLKNLNHENSL